uniref:Peptidase C1A papain C-terminal domain-containing protein n=1 Tax=Tetradesmus obliquus TaxID=3088 RepID=A0A383W081_TETOB|eukprot:jgi/Sobl393_1/5202/SZX71087.1
MALSWDDFQRFTAYKTGVFSAVDELTSGADGVMHAVFCYGWWDDPRSGSDGYWLCKNSWFTDWGLKGTFKMAYGSAYIMQPDYTFAVQFTTANFAARTSQVKQRLKQASFVYDPTAPGCVLYNPKQPLRLVKLADDLATLAVTSSVITVL